MVDDDPLVLMNTAAMLEDLGHTAIEASSGEQALHLLRRAAGNAEGRIDLILTDQAMPGMTGARLIDAARTETPGIPAILASGFSDLPEDGPAGIVRLARALAASLHGS